MENDVEIMCTIPERAEAACAEVANRLLTQVGKIVHGHLDISRNSLYQTVASGSKGNLVNIAQLIGAVGQQSLEGHRTFGSGRIPMPAESSVHVLQKDGFVRHSYFQGLEPCEFFFHAMAGREGLSDTAVKTSTTGYVQRRLVKAMETLCVQYDGTVRNSREHIIQFSYGSDGYDASFLVRHSLPCLLKSPAELRGDFADDEWPAFVAALGRAQRRHVGTTGEVQTVCYFPCRVEHHLASATKGPGPPLAAEEVGAVIRRIVSGRYDNHSLLELHLRWNLRSAITRSYPAAELRRILSALEGDASRARASPGEAVGPIAAQGLGERFSQQCLSNFHFAGVDNATVTQGVPRIKELIDCSKNIKTPVVRAVIRPSHCGEAPLAALRACVPHFMLSHATVDMHVLHDPDYFSSVAGEEDDYVCRRERLFAPRAPDGASPYVMRLDLDREKLAARSLGAAQAATLVAQALQGNATVTWSEDTMRGCFIRVRPTVNDPGDAAACKRACEELTSKLLRDVTLCGLPGISEVRTRKETLWVQPPGGGLRGYEVVLLEASGTNLCSMLGLPELQTELTVSNDVGAVLATLGIEAATRVLFDEMKTTLSGEYICERHIALLCSTMTHLGYLLPISRHGLNRIPDNGPLARCSFEECIDQLFEAALFGETDGCHDVTSRIMTGQRAAVGTGMCHMRSSLVRPEALSKIPETPEEDDVIFTSISETSNVRTPSAPPATHSVERPYADAMRGLSRNAPCAVGCAPPHSFIDVPRSSLFSYAPSSPRHPNGSRKRYSPSSPKHGGA